MKAWSNLLDNLSLRTHASRCEARTRRSVQCDEILDLVIHAFENVNLTLEHESAMPTCQYYQGKPKTPAGQLGPSSHMAGHVLQLK